MQALKTERKLRRWAEIEQQFNKLCSFVVDLLNQPGIAGQEDEQAFSFLSQTSALKQELSKASTDEELKRLEHDRLRPLAFEIRKFVLRKHLMLAEPLWGWSEVRANPNEVFFAGGPQLRRQLESVAQDKRLLISPETGGVGAGETRWRQLRESALGVFDLTSESRDYWPSVCHAYGSALALGLYPIVVVDESTDVPFDFDLRPLLYTGQSAALQLARWIDHALLAVHETTGVSSVEPTVHQTLACLGVPDDPGMQLGDGAGLDAVQAHGTLETLIAKHGRGRWGLLTPQWPARYPDDAKPRCFHVMPFAAAFDDVRETARRACRASGADYIRGDETGEQRVIHSIWEEICRATHIVVDLTGLNVNVSLELGMAQALGRSTLLLTRDDGPGARLEDRLFDEIARLQTRKYTTEDELFRLVSEFVRA